MPKKVIDVSHVTLKGNSMRVTIPKKVSKELGLSGDDIIVFYDDNGIKIKKMENKYYGINVEIYKPYYRQRDKQARNDPPLFHINHMKEV